MKRRFVVDCPLCHWGHKNRMTDINKGYLRAKCGNCGNLYFYRIDVNDIKVAVHQDLPDGAEPPRSNKVSCSGHPGPEAGS